MLPDIGKLVKRNSLAYSLCDDWSKGDCDYGLRTDAAKVDNSPTTESKIMNCFINGCTGTYEQRFIAQTLCRNGEVLVIDHVPAEVCSVCGDTPLAPETVRRMETLVRAVGQPARTVPLYEYV